MREPGALDRLYPEIAALPAACREQARADLEKHIADGTYAKVAECTRGKIVLAEATLRHLLSSQDAGREELFVKIWTQRRDYPYLHTSWATPVDIVELTVPSIT
jgi:hypothetical protein